jgi:glyoxylase-like metal-dependent hydrolase (beta-lactamase superfamily II)
MNTLAPTAPASALPAQSGDHVLPADFRRVALSIVNAYLVGPPDAGDRGWALVDAGLGTSGGAIRAAAAARFGPHARPAAIYLTHGHFDHVGAVKGLATQWDAPVYAHRLELPYLSGRSAYPPPDPTVGGGMAAMSWAFPRGPIDLGDRVCPLPAVRLPGLPGWRWVQTPGHSPGHVSFFRDSDRALIAGDAFVTTRQESLVAAVGKPVEVNGPPAYYTPDWASARRSVERLAGMNPAVAATGHGLPVSGELLRVGLGRLARAFDAAARPAHGRYVRTPARAGEAGVTFVPSSVMDWAPPLVGLAAGVCVGLWRGGRGNPA